MDQDEQLIAGDLRQLIRKTTAHALQCGVLHPIATESRLVESDSLLYIVRILTAMSKKRGAHSAQGKTIHQNMQTTNPFLPYEKDLYVTHIGDHHVCLLNKFNVLDDHILIVTREFEDQETLLTLRDFEALSICLAEIDGLAFYNGGRVAGASQPHKHLQMVPLPLQPDGPATPIDPLLSSAGKTAGIVPGLSFRHLFIPLDKSQFLPARETAATLFAIYRNALHKLGLNTVRNKDPNTLEEQQRAYNLILTRRWVLLVPRSRECFETISVNALGFVGALMVTNEYEFQRLVRYGPMKILKLVGE